AGSHVCDYRAVDAGGREVRAQRLVEVVDPAAPALRCVSVRASPLAHLGAGRARAGGWFFSRALAGADRQDIGYAWDWWSVVALHEGEAGRWHAHRPPVCER
ncbi:MAG: esterase, partial [Thauera phenolivorans]|nr:esterase [Thauera phenolivorans]